MASIGKTGELIAAGCTALLLANAAFAEPPAVQKPSSKADMQAALSAGVSGDLWKEGLLFEGVSSMPWLKSAANWFPGTEDTNNKEV